MLHTLGHNFIYTYGYCVHVHILYSLPIMAVMYAINRLLCISLLPVIMSALVGKTYQITVCSSLYHKLNVSRIAHIYAYILF